MHGHPLERLRPVASREEVAGRFEAVEHVYVDPLLRRWIVELVRATRKLGELEVGASVRGSLALDRVARAADLVEESASPPPRTSSGSSWSSRTASSRAPRRSWPTTRATSSSRGSASGASSEHRGRSLSGTRARDACGPDLPTRPRPAVRRSAGGHAAEPPPRRRRRGGRVAAVPAGRPGLDDRLGDVGEALGSPQRDVFVVLEHFAAETPRVAGRRPAPGVSLYAPPFPWLDKAAAVDVVSDLIARSARAGRRARGTAADPTSALRSARSRCARRACRRARSCSSSRTSSPTSIHATGSGCGPARGT